LRYEIRREFAPYVGFSWSRKLGETADLAEAEGEEIDVASVVVGFRF
jgi:copper resistance protein B